MRTNIEIDDELMAEMLRASGQRTTKAAVEEAMRFYLLAERRKQAIRNLAGIGWDGETEKMPFLREFAEDGTPLDELE